MIQFLLKKEDSMKQNRCKELCKIKNISELAFARLIGVSQEHAKMILDEKIELNDEKLILRICEVLTVDPAFLLKKDREFYGNL
jgi:transcriptional regulator with XRE-family HTH domain